MESTGCKHLSVHVFCFCGHFWGYRLSGTPVVQGPQWVLYCTSRSRAPGFLTTLGTQSLPAQPLLNTTPSESTGCLLWPERPAPWNRKALQLPPPSSAPVPAPGQPSSVAQACIQVSRNLTLPDWPPALPLVPCQTLVIVCPTLPFDLRKWKKVKSLSRVRRFATPWTVASQAPPSMGFSKQEYWSGLPLLR